MRRSAPDGFPGRVQAAGESSGVFLCAGNGTFCREVKLATVEAEASFVCRKE